MKFAVVTEVPDPEGLRAWENLALMIPTHVQVLTADPMKPMPIVEAGLPPGMLLALRGPVFVLGEILLLDENGREPFGRGRKPDKWGVKIETFETAEEAIVRAQEIADGPSA